MLILFSSVCADGNAARTFRQLFSDFLHLLAAAATRLLIATLARRGAFGHLNLAAAFRVGAAVFLTFFECHLPHLLRILNLGNFILHSRKVLPDPYGARWRRFSPAMREPDVCGASLEEVVKGLLASPER
jgi:hypothetical protein